MCIFTYYQTITHSITIEYKDLNSDLSTDCICS